MCSTIFVNNKLRCEVHVGEPLLQFRLIIYVIRVRILNRYTGINKENLGTQIYIATLKSNIVTMNNWGGSEASIRRG